MSAAAKKPNRPTDVSYVLGETKEIMNPSRPRALLAGGCGSLPAVWIGRAWAHRGVPVGRQDPSSTVVAIPAARLVLTAGIAIGVIAMPPTKTSRSG